MRLLYGVHDCQDEQSEAKEILVLLLFCFVHACIGMGFLVVDGCWIDLGMIGLALANGIGSEGELGGWMNGRLLDEKHVTILRQGGLFLFGSLYRTNIFCSIKYKLRSEHTLFPCSNDFESVLLVGEMLLVRTGTYAQAQPT